MMPVPFRVPLAVGLPSFSSPWMAALAAAAIPVVIVYFLKLRRPRQTVPSLVLWQRVMEDQRVNSPFQRFRRNLLLWLQLAMLAFLVLAAMQPLLSGSASSADVVPVIVDCSASMAATDADGRSRMDLVKEQLREEVDALSGDRELAIVAAGPRAVRLCDFTGNRTILGAAIDKLRAYPTAVRLDEALRLAEGMTTARPVDTVRLYSDGNLPVPPDTDPDVAVIPFDLPFEVDFRRVGQPLPNLGIVEASAQRAGPGEWDVFFRVAAGSEPGRAELQLTQGEEPLAPETVVLEAGRSQRISLRVETTGVSSVTAQLTPKQFDALPLDDRVRLDLPSSRNLRVRCDESLTAFAFALDPFASIDRVTTGADLAIVRSEADLADESAAILVGTIPEALAPHVAVDDATRPIIDWQRADPLLQHVRLGGVQLVRSPRYVEGSTRSEIEQAGYRVVAEVEGGPLIVRQDVGRSVRYVLLFDPDLSTLPYRVGFPVMIANAVDLGFRQASLSGVRGSQAGPQPAIPVDEPGSYTVAGPGGSTQTLEVDESRLLRGLLAPDLGEYQIQRRDRVVRTLGVNLLDDTESRLTGVDTIEFQEVRVAATDFTPEVDRPLWRLLAYVALALLALEWWYFHRPSVSDAGRAARASARS